jgi:hypothetical protein
MGIPEVKGRSDLASTSVSLLIKKQNSSSEVRPFMIRTSTIVLSSLKVVPSSSNNTLGLAAESAGPSMRIPFTDSGMSQKCDG